MPRGFPSSHALFMVRPLLMLTELVVSGVRNLVEQHIELADGINLLRGSNAAGKTSLLEAVHLLGRGESFRTRQIPHVLGRGQDALVIRGHLAAEGAGDAWLGVLWRSGNWRFRYAGQDISRRVDLIRKLPLLFADTDIHQLVSGPPQRRRTLMDWGLFHVEPSYLRSWQAYRRALKQRNALLRTGRCPAAELQVWEPALVDAGEQVRRARESYLGELMDALRNLLGLQGMAAELDMQYRPGHAADLTFEAALHHSLPRDRTAGNTLVGPHRGDIRILVDGAAADQVLSRGQQKRLALTLLLAQAEMMVKSAGRGLLMLVDDFSAEMDPANIAWWSSRLAESGIQALLTEVDATAPVDMVHRAMFHVEQGRVRRVI